ncbi:MAG: hypothetical protein QOI74_2922 [Micromonosporaceae bacterium]|nr:hypothetical protein [Micromonosporaceae bacterium]
MNSPLIRRVAAGLAAVAAAAAPLAAAVPASAATSTAVQRLGMQLATPGGATMGSYAGVKVYTYAGVRCTLNGNEDTAKTNTAGGWMGWTFKVNTAGTFTMKVWCVKGADGAALSKPLTASDPALVKTWKTDVTYTGQGATWTGPTIRLPRAQHRFSYTYHCTTGAGGFESGLAVMWSGKTVIDASVHYGMSGASVYTLSEGVFADSGHVTIYTSSEDCTWKAVLQSLR